MRKFISSCFCFAVMVGAALASSPSITAAVIDDAADLSTQQAQEKQELQEMKNEMNDIKGTMREATEGMEQLRDKMNTRRSGAPAQEVHLIARESQVEVAPGVSVREYTYNGQQPGPVIRLKEGQPVRIVLHNELTVPTSLCFHGMILPHAVSGLPRKDAGLVNPGQSYAFQFVAPAAGTYWYHPQVIHADQFGRGLCGAIVVDPVGSPKTYERDVVLVLGETAVASRTAAGNGGHATVTYYTVNGKSAPSIPPIDVKKGQKVRLRLINTAAVACPLFLSGHKFEVVSINGADGLEPHVTRDTLTLQPGDRLDVEFVADNPGVWSLASLLPSQTNNDGRFPGGIAVVLRYADALR